MAFDTRDYEWNDISLYIGGEEITGFVAVKYKEKIEREARYTKGREPSSIQSGNMSYEGELGLSQAAYEKLVELGNGTVLSVVADLLVAYGNPSRGDAIMHKRIRGAHFMEAENAWSQGDKFIDVTLPFIALGVNNRAQSNG